MFRAVAVRLLTDRMACAVTEILAVTGLLDNLCVGIVHLPSL